MDELFYTMKDIQRIFHVSPPTALKIVHTEGFPRLESEGNMRRLLVPVAALNAWIDRHTVLEEAMRPCVETAQKLQAIFYPYESCLETAKDIWMRNEHNDL